MVYYTQNFGRKRIQLWQTEDLQSRNFFDPLGVKLNIHAFLDCKDQLNKDYVVFSQTIASVRIHVECIIIFIAGIKKF